MHKEDNIARTRGGSPLKARESSHLDFQIKTTYIHRHFLMCMKFCYFLLREVDFLVA
jgi:hypothetical protein